MKNSEKQRKCTFELRCCGRICDTNAAARDEDLIIKNFEENK